MTDYVATRTGDRVRVKLSTGWTITHTDGDPRADIYAPGGLRFGTVRAPKPATIERLAAALVERSRVYDQSDYPERDSPQIETLGPFF